MFRENVFANSSFAVMPLYEGFLNVLPFGFLIAIFLESLIINKMLRLNLRDSISSALLANIGSTVIGLIVVIPYELSYSIIFVLIKGGLNDLFFKPEMVTEPYISLYGNWFAWKIVKFWLFWAICFLLSYDSEGFILQKLNKLKDEKLIFRTSFCMNSITYFLLLVYFCISGIGYGETKLGLSEIYNLFLK
ncbi:MAG: hypothetical protein GXO97_04160 [Nitrospirae bacterium]|nr:hypothetical protein [Nitrospirota bacterium]